jgi:putative oxidoreductase
MIKTIFTWAARIIPALILLQTLFYKFTAAPESVYIFEQLGMEPAGRIGIGIGELIAGIALLIPSFSWLGAVLAIGLMSGAIFFHLTKLGIAVQEDGGMLFVMALVVFVFSLITLWLHRKDIPVLGKRIK